MQTAGYILVVDDHEPTVAFIAEALTDEGYTVRTALTAAVTVHEPAGNTGNCLI